ncbi:response regulator transcription factor [Saccharibacillus sp. CPCC 101409]|uniref:response regulator transcription factor n=1 Tax=Saccharibacillus sp. CPCC 101409 TaxID=3058041 RepID=UPI002673B976|nr:response regulator transcription factor [Saccharibacillus sp. CPCC 101409]MDO3410310.1 response regulator transcription factor [Saccharibacillus sp. CPCC 101409]
MYKVFLVDDEPFITEGLEELIDWNSFGLTIAGSALDGREALEALENTPADLLVTDISMPEMTGLELIRRVREFRPELKVIVLSGFNEFNYLKEGMRLGIENYLLKPINVEELEATLAGVTEKLRRAEREERFEAFGTRVIRDNVLHRWLTDRIAPAEFAERAGLLGLPLDRPRLGVLALRSEEDGDERTERTERVLQGELDGFAFRDSDGDTIALLLLPEGDEDGGRGRLLDAAETIRSRLGDDTLRIGVGSAGAQPEHGPASLNEAKRALDYVLVDSERPVLVHERLSAAKAEAPAALPAGWDEYAKLALARDREALLRRIGDDLDRLRAAEGVTPSVLQNAALELCMGFRVILKENRQVENMEPFLAGLERVRTAARIDELVEAVRRVASETVDLLSRETKSPVVQQVLSHIGEHYADELSLKLLGAQFRIHPVYLGQLFHKETGETFTDYLNKTRIERAKELLRTSNLKVQDISRSVGYWETGYFYKQFKKYVGISPTEYKTLQYSGGIT